MHQILETKVQLLQEVETLTSDPRPNVCKESKCSATQLPALCLFCPCCVQEAELARGEAERMASLADAESQRCLALERERVERMEESGGSVFTQQALADKDRLTTYTLFKT